MATIHRLKSGKGWQVRWRDPDGKQRKESRGLRLKSDAEQFAATLVVDRAKGIYVDPKRGAVTVGAWAEQWLAGRGDLKPSTRHRYEGLLRRHVLPRWERVRLSAVGHADVAAWVSRMSADGFAPGTVRQAYRVLSLLLSLAVRDGRLARNVAEGVPLPRARRAEPRFLSGEELVRLADAAGDHRLEVLLLGVTGLRFGELAALRVGRVDHLRRRLTIAESVSEVGGRQEFSSPKSHLARSVPYPRVVADDLTLACAGKDPDEYVFTAPEGGALRLNNWRRRVFDPACRLAGVEGLTPHDLRHTAASLAIAAGGTVKDVQRMLGHASASMTLDVYAGLFEDHLDDVADHLDRLVPQMRPNAPVVDLPRRARGS